MASFLSLAPALSLFVFFFFFDWDTSVVTHERMWTNFSHMAPFSPFVPLPALGILFIGYQLSWFQGAPAG